MYMKASIRITEKNSKVVASQLSKLLADEYLLYTKTRNAHWNIEGADFYAMHKYFETQYEELDNIIDGVAERIRSIGHYVPATLKEFLELTHLSEKRAAKNDSTDFIKDLLSDHEEIIIFIRENIAQFANDYRDLGTSDYITGLLEQHEKMSWMLRSHIK
jgi:starvation-inducible DNA-binding protein